MDSSQSSRGELGQSHRQPSKDPCQTQGSSLPGSLAKTSGALTFLHPQLFSHRRKVSLTWLPILPLSRLGVREQASRSPVRSSLPSAVTLDWAAPLPPGLPIMIHVGATASSTRTDSGPSTCLSLYTLACVGCVVLEIHGHVTCARTASWPTCVLCCSLVTVYLIFCCC